MNQGLAGAAQQVQAMGRGPDTMLAHISPDEAQFIDYMQGGRRTNPTTGLPEYGLFGSILKAVARVAGAVGGFMIGGPAGAAAGAGAATKLTGGSWKDALKAAALSGVGSGVAGSLTGAGTGIASAGTTTGLTSTAPTVATGAAAGSALPASVTLAGTTAPAVGLQAAQNVLTSTPGIAAGLGALSVPLAGHGSTNPAPAAPTDGIHLNDVVPLHRNQLPYTGDIEHYGETGGGEHQFFDEVNPPTQYYAPTTADATPKVFAGGGPVFGLVQPGLTMRGLRGGGIQQPNFGQEGGFGGAGINGPQAPGIGVHAGDLRRAAILGYAQAGGATGMARGGMVHGPSMMPQMSPAARAGAIRGPGGGQEDLIPARLSDGEHVVDAGSVSLAGDGSNTAGQRVMENIKQEIRAQAGQKNPKVPPSPIGKMVARAKKRAGVK